MTGKVAVPPEVRVEHGVYRNYLILKLGTKRAPGTYWFQYKVRAPDQDTWSIYWTKQRTQRYQARVDGSWEVRARLVEKAAGSYKVVASSLWSPIRTVVV